jgi:serine/threonine-protein kinase
MTQELKSLGRYRIQGVLGKGAMGLVYDGLDPTLARRVAIKTILTSTLDEATAKHYAMRFMREVRAVARLNHPNIVQVYDYGAEGELAYIVMEYIQGKELKDCFDAKEQFALDAILRMMGELLDALDFAHEAGVIHRDVKPANVMVDAAGRVKLTDFGVARVSDETGEATRAGAMIGTPAYMSPEQIQGQPIDRRSDIFSAGILFYQLLTGKKPFEGTGWALAKKIVQDEPVPPSAVVPVSRYVDRLVARALAKNAEQRYPSARAFGDALKRVAEGKPPEDPEATVPLPPDAMPAASSSEAEIEFWNDVKDSDDPEEIKLYLEQFPSGGFAAQARQKLAQLAGDKG